MEPISTNPRVLSKIVGEKRFKYGSPQLLNCWRRSLSGDQNARRIQLYREPSWGLCRAPPQCSYCHFRRHTRVRCPNPLISQILSFYENAMVLLFKALVSHTEIEPEQRCPARLRVWLACWVLSGHVNSSDTTGHTRYKLHRGHDLLLEGILAAPYRTMRLKTSKLNRDAWWRCGASRGRMVRSGGAGRTLPAYGIGNVIWSSCQSAQLACQSTPE